MNEQHLILLQPLMDFFEVTLEQLISPSRKGPVKDCRHLCIRALKEHNPEMTLKELGSFFGGRDHTTALSSLREADDMLLLNRKYREIFGSLKQPEKKRLFLPDERVWFNEVTFC